MVGRLGIEVGSMGEQPLRARGYMERRAAFGVTRKNFHTVTNWLLLRQPDDEALKCISMRIDQMLRCLSDCPNQHPRPLRRLNWLEQKQDLDDLKAYVNRLRDTVKVFSSKQYLHISLKHC